MKDSDRPGIILSSNYFFGFLRLWLGYAQSSRCDSVEEKGKGSNGLVNADSIAHSFSRNHEPLPGVSSNRIIAYGV